MDEKTKSLIQEALSGLLTRVENGAEFVSNQLPLVVNEKLAYDFWSYVVYTAIWTAVLLGVFVLSFRVRSCGKEIHDGDVVAFSWVLTISSIFAWFMMLLNNLGVLIMIHVAPRLYILEWLKDTVK